MYQMLDKLDVLKLRSYSLEMKHQGMPCVPS